MKAISLLSVACAALALAARASADCKVIDSLTQQETNYPEGSIAFDRCGARCVCTNGSLENCTRLRKEWTTLDDDEKTRYLNAYKQITETDEFKDLVGFHLEFFGDIIHRDNHFLPWHRWFIFHVEELLQKVDECINQPYWNWARSTNSFTSSSKRATPWQSDETGYGGDGRYSWSTGRRCITSGFFKDFTRFTGESDKCIERRFSSRTLPNEKEMEEMYKSNTDYDNFRISLEGYHNTGHVKIGGDMSFAISASAPEFLLHHTYIDYLWSEWQHREAAYMTDYGASGDLSQAIRGAFELTGENYTVGDFMNVHSQPENVSITYRHHDLEYQDLPVVTVAPTTVDAVLDNDANATTVDAVLDNDANATTVDTVLNNDTNATTFKREEVTISIRKLLADLPLEMLKALPSVPFEVPEDHRESMPLMWDEDVWTKLVVSADASTKNPISVECLAQFGEQSVEAGFPVELADLVNSGDASVVDGKLVLSSEGEAAVAEIQDKIYTCMGGAISEEATKNYLYVVLACLGSAGFLGVAGAGAAFFVSHRRKKNALPAQTEETELEVRI